MVAFIQQTFYNESTVYGRVQIFQMNIPEKRAEINGNSLNVRQRKPSLNQTL